MLTLILPSCRKFLSPLLRLVVSNGVRSKKGLTSILNLVPLSDVVTTRPVILVVLVSLRERVAFQAGNPYHLDLRWLIGSVYAPPHEVSPSAASTLLTEALVASENLGTNVPWLIAGDLNETPDNSHFCDVAASLGGTVCGLQEATRWDSDREIDFFVTCKISSCGQVSSPSIHLSDHRIITMNITTSCFAPTCGKLPKGPQLFCPESLGPEEWREKVALAWNHCTLDNPDMLLFSSDNTDVQTKWDLLQVLIQDTFRHASLQLDTPVQIRSSQLVYKGAVAEVVSETQVCHGPRPCIGHMAERKKNGNLLAFTSYTGCLLSKPEVTFPETRNVNVRTCNKACFLVNLGRRFTC